MQSIQTIFKIGPGPSSSHTFGPMKAAEDMLASFPEADSFQATLYGSLALTGKGHLTDKIIRKTFRPKPVEIVFDFNERPEHPNTMRIRPFTRGAAG